MKTEIERKFLVFPNKLPFLTNRIHVEQGYLSEGPTEVRVRITDANLEGARSYLTVKGPGSVSRPEWERTLYYNDAQDLMKLCTRKLVKFRHYVGLWTVDHYLDRNLWLAEIELDSEDQDFDKPEWLAEEVTNDPQYKNVNIAVPTSW